MKIAIIGSGISGLTSAYLLQQQHDVTVFESAERIGGHTATVQVEEAGSTRAIDTGFIVFNDWTYPNFIRLMDELGVKSKATEMSFSVSCQRTGLEYGGNNLNTLFAQRRNLLNVSFIGMLKDILRFNKEAIQDLESNQLKEGVTLGEYLKEKGYGSRFASHYLIPMGSAIWSSTLDEMMEFPLVFFVRFFKNHGLLSVNDRPQWRVIEGGSSAYLKPLVETFEDRIQLGANIAKVHRSEENVVIHFADGSTQVFDQVVFACHSDEALALLADSSPDEQAILGAIPYRNNEVMLHTDIELLPKKKLAWSSWNYHLGEDRTKPATLSYNMNILQHFSSDTTYVVTLNQTDMIAEDKIVGRFQYSHPTFTLEGIKAQDRWSEINGVNKTWFCGAYWRNGFHEDGCWSGVRVANGLGISW
ncbi:FAD-dependent oxidoreductase [Marinomonas rhizomae]|uniref:Putative NAD/FAD-binding protein n=1 Tax=Marinomonas rhizomae TaxID=491948 RepID=A0A366IXF6_9GAMM|nr:FAD-dependent oxidoreductase [Marinomonas rhizomae]RBP79463.1 putative NAD/FAD-binding protein [Marinomonas rhizomae]RNF71386.1 FAD-dependent oxidoreductase [Marinomonas rhizomae]